MSWTVEFLVTSTTLSRRTGSLSSIPLSMVRLSSFKPNGHYSFLSTFIITLTITITIYRWINYHVIFTTHGPWPLQNFKVNSSPIGPPQKQPRSTPPAPPPSTITCIAYNPLKLKLTRPPYSRSFSPWVPWIWLGRSSCWRWQEERSICFQRGRQGC